MSSRRTANWLFFLLALSLHLLLLAAGYAWYGRTAAKQSAAPLIVNVTIPAAPPSLAAPAPEKAPSAPSRRSTPPKKPVKPAPAKQATRSAKPAEPPPVQAPRQSADPAPVAAPEPAAAPAPAPAERAAVRTEISVNASYVATETEKWYPSLSKRYGEQGTVLVRVHVSADGRAERVELKKRSDYPLLDEAAIGLARSLKYNPAKVDGNPVADWVEIPVSFRLRNP